MLDFRFKNSRYNFLVISTISRCKSLEDYAGNLIEMAHKKLADICLLNISQEDKDIAVEICQEEIREIISVLKRTKEEIEKTWVKPSWQAGMYKGHFMAAPQNSSTQFFYSC